MTNLKIKVRRLDDGSFYVKYWWHWWEDTHKNHCDSIEELGKFLSSLAKNTVFDRWRKQQ